LTRIGKAYSSILDLSENSSVIIKIPFLSKFDYLNTSSNRSDVTNSFLTDFGTFSIGALAPLLGPATVDSTVDIVVWKWFEDLELAEPYSFTLRSHGLPPPVESEIQINLMNRDEENTVIFNNPSIDNSLDHSVNNIGERIVNLRQLLRIHRPSYPLSADSIITPFRDVQITSTDGFTSYQNSDYVTFLSRMYRFWRGGFSLKVQADTGTWFRSQIFVGNFYTSPNSHLLKNTSSHTTFPAINPLHEVRLPFNSQTYRRVITDEFVNENNIDYSYSAISFESDSDTTHNTFIAGDDNLSYGWLVGPPVVSYDYNHI
jgi:hypothetical protein